MYRFLAAATMLVSVTVAQPIRVVNVACCQFQDSVSLTNVTTIPVGTTVKWMCTSCIPSHTVTSGLSPTSPGAGSLFNGSLSPASSQFQFTFNNAGTFPYFCSPHFSFGMVGTVNVFVPASATVNGTGCLGSNALPLTLVANGLPTLGNNAFSMTVSNGPSNGSSLWFAAIGAQTPPIAVTPTCNLYIELNSFLQFISLGITPLTLPLGAGGAATLPFPVAASLAPGTRLDVQVACPDATPGGLTTSNALALIFGN